MGKTFSTGLLTNGLWQDSSNNIGIGGAANASFKLQVTGATNLTGALSGTSATFTSGLINGTTDAFFDVNRSASGNAGRVRFQTAGTDDFEIGLKGGVAGLHITKGDATELVTVLTSGNVGIGTNSPFAIADVNLTVNGPTGSAIQLGFNGTRYGQFFTSTDEVRLSAVANLPLTFYSNNLERMRISSSGNVGIGDNNPTETLVLKKSSYPTIKFIDTTDNFSGYLQYHTDANEFRLVTITNHPIIFSTNDTEKFRITSGGTIALNGNSDVTNVNERFTMGYFVGNYGWLQTWDSKPLYFNKLGNAVYAGTQRIDNNSDARIKDNIESISGALDTILSLKGRKFNMLDENGKLRYGFVAQEVQPYLNDFVTESDRTFEKDDVKIENLLTLESSGASWAALLVEAIKEQQAQIEELKELIKNK